MTILLLRFFLALVILGWPSLTLAGGMLHPFEPGNDRTYQGWTYERDVVGTGNGFKENAYPYNILTWYQYDWSGGPSGTDPTYGFVEIDGSQGAEGSSGSLKATITGGVTNGGGICGGAITSKEDFLANPSRVCNGKGGSLELYFIHYRPWGGSGGRSTFTQAIGSDRMSFYIKFPTEYLLDISGDANLHVGTYTYNPAKQETEPADEEDDPIGSHFYHYLNLSGGGWIHVLLDQHPQWRRSAGINPINNPTKPLWGYNYYDGFHSFYLQQTQRLNNPWYVWMDQIRFYHTSTTPEPNQNDDTIQSVAVAYYPSDKHWEIGFYDQYDTCCRIDMSTYEIRYSPSPITNSNFQSATLIPVERYGPSSDGKSAQGLVKKKDPDLRQIWTRFTLPDAVVNAGGTIYFAIKDVSKVGTHCAGESSGVAICDNRNAPNSLIHTTDYFLSQANSDTNPPAPPKGLVVR